MERGYQEKGILSFQSTVTFKLDLKLNKLQLDFGKYAFFSPVYFSYFLFRVAQST